MALDLFRLLVFVTVVDRNGYSAAAERLHISQATASFHVHELERILGAELLVYERRAVHLTQAGEEVYRSARTMLQDGERLVQSVRDIRHGHGGRVSVGISMAFEQPYFFERVIAPFYAAHPDTRLSLRFGHSVGHAEAVQDHELDLAYVLAWQRPSGVRWEVLHQAAFTFLVSPEHPLARREVVTAQEIADAGLIAAPLDSVEWSYYGSVLRRCGLDSVDPVLEIDGIQARVLAAQAGLGVFGTFFPHYAGETAYGSLVPLRVDRPLASADVGLVSRTDGTSSASADAFVDWLREVAASARPPAAPR